jgi:AcrR family transcriptional regulator
MSTFNRRGRASATATRKKPAYHHGELRKALIAATLKLIPTMGVRELSLRAVARRAGVSHSASYRHFSSKESLLAAIAEQGFILLAEAMRSAIEAHPGNSLAKLQAAGTGYVTFGLQHPHHLQIMFGGAIGRFEEYPTLVAAAKHARQQLTGVVNEGLTSGAVRTANEQLVQVAAWAIVHGLAVLMAGGQVQTPAGVELSQAEKAAMANGVTRLFCEGLAP